MNVVLLVIDSLRGCELDAEHPDRPRTPFLDGLVAESVAFRRAYATECWTLPTHLSMFTGALPSEHGAHFQSMAYRGSAPTLAELLFRAGRHTEVVTRNSLFDGSVPGSVRGFRANTRPLADLGGVDRPLALLLALAKPRVQRLIAKSGYFSLMQKEHRDFLTTLARMGIPADHLALSRVLDVMQAGRDRGTPYFVFCNLYDVHAPYAPTPSSPLRSFRSAAGWAENVRLPRVLPKIGSHAYLRPDFRLSNADRRMLLGRYRRAIELIDAKLATFWQAATAARLLDDTLVVLTADHGEAFGEHGLYFHDASVYDVHLRVPLWVRHPQVAPEVVDDVVSTRGVFDLIRRVALDDTTDGTLLDRNARAAMPVALAQHYHYPVTDGIQPRYARNIAAAIVGMRKVIRRHEGLDEYDLARDGAEAHPEPTTVERFAARCRRDGAPPRAIASAVDHLVGSSVDH